MNKRLLPLGMQDFASIREDGFVYVDKTARIHELITGSGRQFFLSRPRRFGKSLLCSTLGAIFEGRRELFQEIAGFGATAIDSLEWGWERHPVIKLDLNPGNYPANGLAELHTNLLRDMEACATKHGVPLEGVTMSDKFARLILALRERTGERVAVIIDEYDKPMLDTMQNPELHIAIRDELKGFYSVLKSFGGDLRFVFITGVTKFAHISLFSGLNQLKDLTFDPQYADLCGVTQEELEGVFAPEISAIADTAGISRVAYLYELRCFYNGYRFSKKPLTVYNPFGLLSHFDAGGEFMPYWYETGTPSFLVDLITMQKINIVDLSDMHIRQDSFRKYDVENMDALPVLCQAGYLTISDYDAENSEYTLDYPNIEVRASFAVTLIEQYLNVPRRNADALIIKLPKALKNGDIESAMNAIRQFLAAVPYQIIKESENYYETAVFLMFKIFGADCQAETQTADGRIDTLVKTANFVYCFEFKLNKSADAALAQIDTKEYLLPWTGSGKKLFKVGVNFNSETKNIGEWKYETVG